MGDFQRNPIEIQTFSMPTSNSVLFVIVDLKANCFSFAQFKIDGTFYSPFPVYQLKNVQHLMGVESICSCFSLRGMKLDVKTHHQTDQLI